jgi:hypothetical protein
MGWRGFVKRLGLILAALALVNAPVAQAEVGGSVVGPGACDFPAVGYFGTALNGVWYICSLPVEENGTHYATLYGGWSSQGQGSMTGGSGFGIGLSINLGGQGGQAFFLWPDGTIGPMPNPPGAWKQHLVPKPAPMEHRINHVEPYMQDTAIVGQTTPDVPPPPDTFQPSDNPAQGFVLTPPPNQTNPGNTNPEQQLPDGR